MKPDRPLPNAFVLIAIGLVIGMLILASWRFFMGEEPTDNDAVLDARAAQESR